MHVHEIYPHRHLTGPCHTIGVGRGVDCRQQITTGVGASEKKALNKLEEQITCPVCLDTFTDPKQLQCHHVYCRGCLVKLVERDEQGQLVLPCPNCRHVTPVPANGVRGLQPAFQTNNLLEIQGP